MAGEHERADDAFTAEEARWADRYGLLFLLILVALVLTAANTTWLKIAAVLVQGGVVLFAFLAARVGRRAWRVAIVLVPLAVILGIAGRFGDSRPAEAVAATINLVLPAAAIVALGRRIVVEPFVSSRTIIGLLCVYLLIGMTFAATYITIAVVSDEPFFVQTDHARAGGLHVLQLRHARDRRVRRLHRGEPDAPDARRDRRV